MTLTRVLMTVGIAVMSLGAVQGVPFSQHGRVSQRVSHTNIDIEFNRPVARGRALFGALVKWDAPWNPGADSATYIRFDKDVVVHDKPLKKGEYSLWLIPRESAPWTLILNSQSHVFHAPYPGPDSDVLRVDIPAERGAHMETMAFYFPVVGRDSVVLRFHWGETILPIRIRVSREP
jgi:hypothetical protein